MATYTYNEKVEDKEATDPPNPPPLFSEFGQNAKDLLNRGFVSGQSFSLVSLTPFGIGLTTTVTKSEDVSIGSVGATIKSAPGVTADITTGTLGTIQGLFKWENLARGLTGELNTSFPDISMGKASLQFRNPYTSISGSVGFQKLPPLELAASLGGFGGGISLGGNLGYDFNTRNITQAFAGVALSMGDLSGSIITDAANFQSTNIHYSHTITPTSTIAVQYTSNHGKSPDLITYGGSCQLDEYTTVKARFNTDGTKAGLIQHTISPQAMLSLMLELGPKVEEKGDIKFGVNVSITK